MPIDSVRIGKEAVVMSKKMNVKKVTGNKISKWHKDLVIKI